jgi:hypothetical protein
MNSVIKNCDVSFTRYIAANLTSWLCNQQVQGQRWSSKLNDREYVNVLSDQAYSKSEGTVQWWYYKQQGKTEETWKNLH